VSTPLAPALESFAKLLAVGVAATEAYSKSGVGAALACSVSQAERNPDIVARVAWLRENIPSLPRERDLNDPFLDPKDVTREHVMGMLLRDRIKATATGQINAAVNAAKLLGQEIGMFVERSVTVTTNVEIPDLELAQRIAYLLMSGEALGTTLDITPRVLPPENDRITTSVP